MAKKNTIDITFNARLAKLERRVATAEKRVISSTARMQRSANMLANATQRLPMAFGGVAGAGLAMGLVIKKGVDSFINLEDGMRNVNTILKLSEKELASYTKQVEALQSELGVSTEDLTNGLYQTVSAGVSAGDAIEFLGIATKASIAGISSVETAVDGLTTVLNAFHLETSEATKISDIMFQTVKLGKTNFEQLASSISEFAPMAYSLGLSFEQTAGALATITKQGVSTSQAATQLNAVFTGVLKGQERARGMSEQVAEAFSIQALKAKGLQKFLVDLEFALNGDQEAMVKLFGRAEAVKGMLQLTGGNAKMAAKDLDSMKNSSNAMGEAFAEQEKKTSRNASKLSENVNKLVQTFAKLAKTPVTNAISGLDAYLKYYLNLYDGVTEVIDKISESLPKLKAQLIEAGQIMTGSRSNQWYSKGLDFNAGQFSKDDLENLRTGKRFIPSLGMVTNDDFVKETNNDAKSLVKTFNMYSATQDEINDKITELRDLRKELVVWSGKYIQNLEQEKKLSNYLTSKPVKYSPIGNVSGIMMQDQNITADNADVWLKKIMRTPDIRFTQRNEENTGSRKALVLDWIEQSFAEQDRLFNRMYNNASELGFALEDAFSGHGKTLLSSMNQALQIALRISDALRKDDGTFAGGLGTAASIVPGASFIWDLFGGGKAGGGHTSPMKFYEVNEKGIEGLSVNGHDYLMMGANSGYITPNERISMSGFGSKANNDMKETNEMLEVQNMLLQNLSEAFDRGINSTTLNARVTNRQIYFSNKKGSNIYKRYHG